MTVFTLIFLWIFWLAVLAIGVRWILGGFIDCIRKGSKAGLGSWMGFTAGLIIAFFVYLLCTV